MRVVQTLVFLQDNDNGELLEKVDILENGNCVVTYLNISGQRVFKIMNKKIIELKWEIKL